MAVESASDLASMFDDDEFAEAASYVPPLGGSASACTVIVDRGQGRNKFVAGDRALVGSERHLWVRQADLAQVARDGTFTLGVDGEVLKVCGMPKLDQTGGLWSVELAIVG